MAGQTLVIMTGQRPHGDHGRTETDDHSRTETGDHGKSIRFFSC